MAASRSRSPIKDGPLRNPGQSIDERLDDVLFDGLLMPLAVALFAILLAAMEWWREYVQLPPRPRLYAAIAVVAVGYAAIRIIRVLPEARRLKLARDGERAVGQFLDRLRERGYQVFHDVVGAGFNLDHVLVGPKGVYTVETKTFSKPQGRESKVEFDGETLKVDGFEPDRDPVIQAKAQASWLRELLTESTGQRFPVRPVILFPGWYVEQRKGSTRDVWVLNPKALPDFLEQEAQRLAVSDIKLASFHLSRFIRARSVRGLLVGGR